MRNFSSFPFGDGVITFLLQYDSAITYANVGFNELQLQQRASGRRLALALEQ